MSSSNDVSAAMALVKEELYSRYQVTAESRFHESTVEVRLHIEAFGHRVDGRILLDWRVLESIPRTNLPESLLSESESTVDEMREDLRDKL